MDEASCSLASSLPGEPVPAEDLLPAIDTYNAGLKKVTLRLAPSISVDGAGLTLLGTF